jgi:hypothetical protein
MIIHTAHIAYLNFTTKFLQALSRKRSVDCLPWLKRPAREAPPPTIVGGPHLQDPILVIGDDRVNA